MLEAVSVEALAPDTELAVLGSVLLGIVETAVPSVTADAPARVSTVDVTGLLDAVSLRVLAGTEFGLVDTRSVLLPDETVVEGAVGARLLDTMLFVTVGSTLDGLVDSKAL